MVGLVAELLLQLRHLSERVLQPAVLEQDARVARKGLEELEISVTERADVAGPLADHEQPKGPVLAP